MHTPINLKEIHIHDTWFDHYRQLVNNVVIPYQWAILHDDVEGQEPSHSIHNLKLAAQKIASGSNEEQFQGFVFQDSDPLKWIEAAAYVLSDPTQAENVTLKSQIDELVDLIAAAQCDDGYLNSYFTLENPDKRWKNICDCHELYVAGHLIEAAVAYHSATGESKLLEVAKKFADLIYEVFGLGENQIPAYPGHEEIELALVRLYKATGIVRYLNLAKYFIDQRGQEPNYFLEERKSPDFFAFYPGSENLLPHLPYSQSHKPVREQTQAEGHAVRAVYLYSAMADVGQETGDKELLKQCEVLWNDIVSSQMYVTGGIGQSGHLERFTCPDDLPNDGNYSETCASIGLAMFSHRMGLCTGLSKYYDIVELELFNGIASGLSHDGKRFFYVNPMEVWSPNCLEFTSRGHVKAERQGWFGCACCPPNLARTYAGLGRYILTEFNDEIFLNQYIGFTYSHQRNERKSVVTLTGNYASEGKMKLTIQAEKEQKIALRIPAWCREFKINNRTVEPSEDGYYHLVTANAEYSLDFCVQAEFLLAKPEVRANRGLVTLRRGPLIYAAESSMNGENLASLLVDPSVPVKTKQGTENFQFLEATGWREEYSVWPKDTLYRTYELTNRSMRDTAITYIPYAFWGNKSEVDGSEMRVWLRAMEGEKNE